MRCAQTTVLLLAITATVSLAGCLQPAALQTLKQQQLSPPPQTVTFIMTGYVPPVGRRLREYFVSNFSAKAAKGHIEPMTSRDLPDSLKQALAQTYGFTTSGPYSTGFLFSDLFFYLTGITAQNQALLTCPNDLQASTASDAISFNDAQGFPQFFGLRDCEKYYLGLDIKKFDYDGDGVPDYLELRCGMNPKNPNDAAISVAADEISNIEKCKQNIPLDESAGSQPNKLFAYKYQKDLQPDGTLTIKVSNIPIVNQGQDNLVAIYLTETDLSTTGSGSTPATGLPYLYTAYAILNTDAAGKTFAFPFWALRDPKNTVPASFTSKALQFQ